MDKWALGGLEADQFRIEFKTKLRRLVFWQPHRHLRKDGAVEQKAMRIPRQLCRSACLGENLVQPDAHPIRIGGDNGLRFGLRLFAEQIELGKTDHDKNR